MIGIVIAMESEAQILWDAFKKEGEEVLAGKKILYGTAFGRAVAVTVCGVGKVNAAHGAALLVAKGAELLLNLGVAGGLSGRRTELAAVYSVSEAMQYDFDLTAVNGGAVGTLNEETENYLPLFLPAGLPFAARRLASGDRFNDSESDHALLTNTLAADIRDMEGAAVAQVAKNAGVPFVAVKAISDVYGMGSTAEQYAQNLSLAIQSLKAQLETIFLALPKARSL